MPTSFATETLYRRCRGCGETFELDALVDSAVWTDPAGQVRADDACVACGGRLEGRVRQTFARVTGLNQMVLGGVYYCRAAAKGWPPFAGRRFELVAALHDCEEGAVRAYDTRTSWLLENSIGCLTGRIIDAESWPDEARRLCYPLAFFGLGEADDYETFVVS